MSARKSLPALVICFFAFLVPAASQADTPADHTLSSPFPGLEVARCMFPQGKLVLWSGEDFHVLRRGDAVPGQPGLRVLEITDRQAVLIQGPKGSGPSDTPAIPERLVKIEKSVDGDVTVTVMSARMPRVEGPEQQDEATIYSPWSDGGAPAGATQTEGSGAPPKTAPLIEPLRAPGFAGRGSESSDGEEQR